MSDFGPIGHLLRRVFSRMARKGVELNEAAQDVLKKAEARGYSVKRVKQQGAECILIAGPNERGVYLWSSEDVIDYGKSKNLL